MPGAVSATRTPLLKRDQLIGYRGVLTSASCSRNWGGMRTASASSLQIYSAPATSLLAHSILPLWKLETGCPYEGDHGGLPMYVASWACVQVSQWLLWPKIPVKPVLVTTAGQTNRPR